jgi:hypothetical protein
MTLIKKLSLVLDAIMPFLLFGASVLLGYGINRCIDALFQPITNTQWETVVGVVFSIVTFLYLTWVKTTALRLFVNILFTPLILVGFHSFFYTVSTEVQLAIWLGLSIWLCILGKLASSNRLAYACSWGLLGYLLVLQLYRTLHGLELVNHTTQIFMGRAILSSFELLWPQSAGVIIALFLRHFWLSHLQPQAVAQDMSHANIKAITVFMPMFIAIAIFVLSFLTSYIMVM